MSPQPIFHQFFGGIEDGARTTILEKLSDAGVSSTPFTGDSIRDSGLVFFDRYDEPVREFLRSSSRGGLARVITVLLSSTKPPNDLPWGLLHDGASDVVWWRDSCRAAEQIAARFKRWTAVDEIVDSPLIRQNLIGRSPVWINTLRQVVEVATFTDAPVLITGESGTGKELIARLIHTLDRRSGKRNLVVLDCTTIVPDLSGSEFFGHERGAFTGAIAQREGAFALADGGTLFLDEVGELPLTLQAELLRVVQEHTYKRVGSNTWQRTEFRLVCATNRNLLEQEERGEFRRDFFHRIATWTCHLPPLRERPEDILPLTRHFFEKVLPDGSAPELDDSVCEYLIRRRYPGNVRELSQLVRRIACHHAGDGPITAGDIPRYDRPASIADSGDWCDEGFERSLKRAVLMGINLKTITDTTVEASENVAIEAEDYNTTRAAQRLGISERTLQMHRAARRQSSNNGSSGAARADWQKGDGTG